MLALIIQKIPKQLIENGTHFHMHQKIRPYIDFCCGRCHAKYSGGKQDNETLK